MCGVLGNNQILILEHSRETTWEERIMTIEAPGLTLATCCHVVYAYFANSSGEDCKQIWISYKNKPILMSFDVMAEKQLVTADCAELFKESEFLELS